MTKLALFKVLTSVNTPRPSDSNHIDNRVEGKISFYSIIYAPTHYTLSWLIYLNLIRLLEDAAAALCSLTSYKNTKYHCYYFITYHTYVVEGTTLAFDILDCLPLWTSPVQYIA